jgi:hypothetical protein
MVVVGKLDSSISYQEGWVIAGYDMKPKYPSYLTEYATCRPNTFNPLSCLLKRKPQVMADGQNSMVLLRIHQV